MPLSVPATVGLTLIRAQTVGAAVAAVDFTGIDATYDTHLLTFTGVVPGTSGAGIALNYHNGTSWVNFYTDVGKGFSSEAGEALYRQGIGRLDASWEVSNDATLGGFNAEVWLSKLATTATKHMRYQASFRSSVGVGFASVTGSGLMSATTATTGLRVICTTGNIAAGTLRLYGVKK